ncbi:MAG: ribonuclease R, partial [Marivirga sp.]
MNKKFNKRSGKKQPKRNVKALPDLKNEIQQILDYNLHKSYTVRTMAKALQSNSAEAKKIIERILNELVQQGNIEMPSRSTFMSTKEPEFIVGKIDHVNPRMAFLIAEGREKDVI